MSNPPPFYITTPIYYVTDVPHIGHLYTTVAADIAARYRRMRGGSVWFLTGTDEHGQKIQKKAKENGETPLALADRVVKRYMEAWFKYTIQYDDFIRTTEHRHKKVVQEFIARLMKTGDVYLGSYEGWYCVPDETYWVESQVADGKCPDCGRPVERLKEESYFFKMSKYQDRLLKHIESHPKFILPESRKNEVVSFVSQGLKDISISRTTIQWGIPMPPDPEATKEHKVYVWFDALTNYISALSPLEDNKEKFKTFWPHAFHIVGKDIIRFHAVYWPTFLMALELPLPKQIVAHGWLTESNRKISKSVGNVIDPFALADEVGVDGMRYFLFREFTFGLDGEYNQEAMYNRINSDLANDYGNSLSRVLAMMLKYFGETVIDTREMLSMPSVLQGISDEILTPYCGYLDEFQFHKALDQVWKIVTAVNKFIDESAPWKLGKSQDPADRAKLTQVLLHCHEAIRIVSLCLLPFMPSSATRALDLLGEKNLRLEFAKWGKGPPQVQGRKCEPLFPRLELAQ